MDILYRIKDRLGVTVYSEPEIENVIDEYWILPEFSKVKIVQEGEALKYYLIEPTVSESEYELLNFLYNETKRKIFFKDVPEDEEGKIAVMIDTIEEILDDYSISIDDELLLKIIYYFIRDIMGFGAIDPIMRDENIEDIGCNGYNTPIFCYHRKYGNLATNLVMSKEEIDSLVVLLCQRAGKHISLANPIVDATLEDGSRLNATYGTEVTAKGSTFTIRKFRAEPFTPLDLLRYGTMNSEILAYFWLLVENKMNVMVIGETASGKTTALNALMMFLPPDSKVVSIEDTREIQIYHENWIPGVTRIGTKGEDVSMYDLLKAALRQRPDYIVVGEVRGKEAQTLFQAMSTGHSSYATFHAGSVEQLINRLESEPLNVPRILIQFINAVSIQFMWAKGGIRKRRTKGVFEIFGMRENEILVGELYRWDPRSDTFITVSESRNFEKIADVMGVDVSDVYEELAKRKEFLDALHARGVKDYKEFTKFIHMYYRDPAAAFDQVVASNTD
jgi:flagellar protein FlaI